MKSWAWERGRLFGDDGTTQRPSRPWFVGSIFFVGQLGSSCRSAYNNSLWWPQQHTWQRPATSTAAMRKPASMAATMAGEPSDRLGFMREVKNDNRRCPRVLNAPGCEAVAVVEASPASASPALSR